jgi:hypothetical protein
MSSEEIDRAVSRVASRRTELAMHAELVANWLTGGEGVEMIHQASVQSFLWHRLPRTLENEEWQSTVEATAALLEELNFSRLAEIARSQETKKVLAAWDQSSVKGAAASLAAVKKSGVEAPDTTLLAWGSFMGLEEARSLDVVERTLGEAIASGKLVPGSPRWQAKAAAITEAVLARPLDLPAGQTLAGLITTERVGTWIDTARHPLHRKWRSAVANRLLHPIEPPLDPGRVVQPMRWLLEHTAQPDGASLTQSNYLARATVLEAVEKFGWWDWEKAPHSEADVHELTTLRQAASRLRLVRRRGRRLLATRLGSELLADPERLWQKVATETEDGEGFTRAVTEIVGLRLLNGSVDSSELSGEITPLIAAQGWSSGGVPIKANDVDYAMYGPLRWWRLFGAVDEVKPIWDPATVRRVTAHTFTLTPAGQNMVLAYLRARAAGPRMRMTGA